MTSLPIVWLVLGGASAASASIFFGLRNQQPKFFLELRKETKMSLFTKLVLLVLVGIGWPLVSHMDCRDESSTTSSPGFHDWDQEMLSSPILKSTIRLSTLWMPSITSSLDDDGLYRLRHASGPTQRKPHRNLQTARPKTKSSSPEKSLQQTAKKRKSNTNSNRK